ncbi:MAG TPA: hypothetical protein VFS12_17605, partial [Terriglobia bacterium]|nr:hypothetical protein [Terriglobia bacterium]
MNKKKPTRIIVTLGIIVGFVLLSSVLAYSQAAPVGSRSVRQVRAIETADLGASNPLGVAFSAQANAFLLLGDQNATQSSGAGATIMMITLFEEDLAGSMSVAGWAPDPLNLTFDDKTDSLLFLDQSAG